MQEYDIKRQVKSGMTAETLKAKMGEAFGSVSESGGRLVASYGALAKIECWLSEKKKLCVETVSNPQVSNAEAAETIARYNSFLQNATGYSSKERRKKATKVE